MLTPNEAKVLALIEEDPFRTQQELATLMGISRSTVASLISALTQKHQLRGRAYILNEARRIYCIGGMNIDRKFRLTGAMQLGTSNPVTSTLSVGGVVRNVAENLGRLGQTVQLLSVAGMDQDYDWIKQQTQAYVDMSQVTQIPEAATSTYSAILDESGDMQLALADMAIADQMDLDWISQFAPRLKLADYLILDLNLPLETVTYLIQLAKAESIPLAIIPVSGPKMSHLPEDLSGVSWLVVNEDESISRFGNLPAAELVEAWLATGVLQVVMTRGTRSSFYGHQDGSRQEVQPLLAQNVVDVTGAGDAFSAGLLYGQLTGHDAKTSIYYGMANSYHTVQVKQTVRLNLSASQLESDYQTLKERGLA